jgi:hypothetical protein
MNRFTQLSIRILLLAAAVLAASGTVSADEIATATYTNVQVSPGIFQYDLTLTDTGTTTIGTFWFSWVPGNGFMSVTPTNVVAPAGWSDLITDGGRSIQFTTGTPINPGSSVSGFIFDSTMTPAQMAGIFGGPGIGTGDAITTSFIYSGAPFSDNGVQIVATAARVTAPEPATFMLLALSLAVLALGYGLRNREVNGRAI